jgi:hypothetical protein
MGCASPPVLQKIFSVMEVLSYYIDNPRRKVWQSLQVIFKNYSPLFKVTSISGGNKRRCGRVCK